MALTTEQELRRAYAGEPVAHLYVGQRFGNELNRLLHDRQVAAVNRVIERARPLRILEIAPGPGRLTRDVRTTGSLVCLEFNEGMIAEARAACDETVRWVRGDGFRLPLRGEFDVVYSFRFVRHFHREDRWRLYAEIRRVLRPGGCFVMDAVNERVSRPLREANADEYTIYDELHRPHELREELTDAGFNAIELEPVQKYFGLQYRSQVLLGPRANWLNRLVIRGLERLPRRDGLEWIVTARRKSE
jgi:SAM-dependent methyltransferase